MTARVQGYEGGLQGQTKKRVGNAEQQRLATDQVSIAWRRGTPLDV